jgi:hypothetical protein
MACILKPVVDSPDFEAPTDQTAVLVTKDHIGSVLIAKAEYAGAQLVPQGQAVAKIELTVAAGRNTLKLVFVFTAGTAGRGELREDCGDGDSHFLRDLDGSEPFQMMRIIGR